MPRDRPPKHWANAVNDHFRGLGGTNDGDDWLHEEVTIASRYLRSFGVTASNWRKRPTSKRSGTFSGAAQRGMAAIESIISPV